MTMRDQASTTRIEIDPIPDAALYPPRLREAERRLRGTQRIGIALSGGGIRSATLSLGFFQGLAEAGLLRYVDFLSTVSGGGYFGGFLAHLVQRPEASGVTGTMPAEEWPDAVLKDRRSAAVDFLRRNGRYLTPSGTGDAVLAGAITVRNWISVLIVLALLALTVLGALTALRYELADVPGLEQWAAAIALGDSGFHLSPWVYAAAVVVLAGIVPAGWAYWLVRDSRQARPVAQAVARWLAPIAAVALGAAILFGHSLSAALSEPLARALLLLAGVAAIASAQWLLFCWRSVDQQRYFHSRNLARAFIVTGVVLAITAVDSIGQSFASQWTALASGSGAVVAFIAAARGRLVSLAGGLKRGSGPALPVTVIALLASAVILLVLLGALAAVPYVLLAPAAAPGAAPPALVESAAIDRVWLVTGVAAILSLAIGVLRPFVNRSSLHAFYEARLRRAYLGASNPERYGKSEHPLPESEPHPKDGMSWAEYLSLPQRGPIHLINVTINETIDGRTQTQQRDRKGITMAVGPAGVSVSRTHHGLWEMGTPMPFMDDMRQGANRTVDHLLRAVHLRRDGTERQRFRVIPIRVAPEVLDPGRWLAISGAAVSTGLGARTSLGLSLLLGLFNVRLGYWWRSGIEPADRRGVTSKTWIQLALTGVRKLVPVQSSLLAEWFARFTGTGRNEWNLTDGGHFENLGAYELLRRRLKLIIVCDHEQDERYEFGGLANLVLKARVDLDAEIDFLDDPAIVRAQDPKLGDEARRAEGLPPLLPLEGIGSLDALRRGYRRSETMPQALPFAPRAINDGDARAFSLVHAALARVTYGTSSGEAPNAGREQGWLLYVKSSLTGDEPADVLQYHAAHPAFPHESTADQFFDEAQWESHRALGVHVAEKLFLGQPELAKWVRAVAAG